MLLLHVYVQLLKGGFGNMLVKMIEHSTMNVCLQAAGICRQSENHEQAFNAAIEAGHVSLLEFWGASFKVEGMSRVCSHQLVRHRVASFAQSSQRALAIEGLDWFVIPATIAKYNKTAEYYSLLEVIQQTYDSFIEAGIPKEDARFILPNATKTSLIITMNARELHHFFALRCCYKAQWEIKEMADYMLLLCKEIAPIIFKDAGRQCKTCKEPCKHQHMCKK